MRLITDVLRDIRKGRPVEEATMKAIVGDVAERTGCPAVFGKSEN